MGRSLGGYRSGRAAIHRRKQPDPMVAPPPIIERKSESTVRPRDVVLVLFVFILLTLVMMEVLFRNTTTNRQNERQT
jgi:hypothetical protein